MRYLFIAIALLFVTALSYGQRFHGGPMAGLVVSQVDGDNLGGYNKPGFRAGGWVNTDISKLTTLQLEMQYIQKGSKISEQELKSGRYYHVQLNYLQVSFLGKYELTPKLKGEAGIAGGYLFEALED
ncbi:MAG: outer membrane beta-barrel protein, partial [Bacteroidota bacterium]